MTDRHYDSEEGEFVDFETLADWASRDKAKDARIAELEAEVARLREASSWQMSPAPKDRPIIGLPRGLGHDGPRPLDGMDASVTWWIQSEGRWANWDWSYAPVGWLPLPPDPDTRAALQEKPHADGV